MASYRFRGALQSAEFPLVSTLRTRSTIVPGYDNNQPSQQSQTPTSGESAATTLAECIYCENVVPTSEGIQSVGYRQVIPPIPGETSFDSVITLRDANENSVLFSPAQGKNYIYSATAGVWVSTNPIPTTGATVSHAYVNGQTFVCYAYLGVFQYDSVAGIFSQVTLTGVDVTTIGGVCGSSNYLILFSGSGASNLTVYWSNLSIVTDFAPSQLTGAGYSIPQDLRGQIVGIAPFLGGFFIYSTRNVVAAVYTNNALAPFNFKEVGSSGGIASANQITIDHNSGPQYAWTTGGLQTISSQNATSVRVEVNDFLAGRMWEDWNTVTKSLDTSYATLDEFKVKVTLVTNRYLIVSYSTLPFQNYNYALVYDVQLKRWGKLKISHVDCFFFSSNEFGTPLPYGTFASVPYTALSTTTYAGLTSSVSGVQNSKNTVAFLSPDGTVQLLDMSYEKGTVQQGVAVFGKFQLTRQRRLELQQLELEGNYTNPTDGAEINTVTAIASLDGYNLNSPKQMVLVKRAGKYSRYAKRLTGLNLSFAIEGTFALSAYLLEVTLSGDR